MLSYAKNESIKEEILSCIRQYDLNENEAQQLKR